MSDEIKINKRYSLRPSKAPGADETAYDIYDRARQFTPQEIIFSNGSEQECREWIERNCEEPAEHTRGPWDIHETDLGLEIHPAADSDGIEPIADIVGDCINRKANAELIKTAPKLLAKLEEYNAMMPCIEATQIIAEARGWTK